MIIKIEISIQKSKYGTDLANTTLEIDSDYIDHETIRDLAAGLASSAIQRAKDKIESQCEVPTPSPLPDAL